MSRFEISTGRFTTCYEEENDANRLYVASNSHPYYVLINETHEGLIVDVVSELEDNEVLATLCVGNDALDPEGEL